MIKALLKKQWIEGIAFLFYNKDGKKRSVGAFIGLSLFMLYGLGAFAVVFFMLGKALCEPFVAQGLDWVYFAFMGTVATAFGVLGGIFTAKTKLYEAKDNDLLLSMPIPSWLILFSRTLGLYAFTFLFQALTFLPAVVCYFTVAEVTFLGILGCLLTLLLMPLGTLAICYVFGWLLALVTAKLPGKNVATTLFAVGGMALYFFLYSKINDALTYVVANGGEVAEKMRTWLYPFGKLGEACAGDMLSLLLYALLSIAPFAIVYAIISKTYLHLVTSNRGGKKAKYVSKERKQRGVLLSLMKKEAMRFTKNPMIALNCLLGTAFCLILPFLSLFAPELIQMLQEVNFDEIFAMIIAAIICAVVSMNMVSAASVSLEGESLWVVRSMPVSTENIFLAKAGFHFLTTAIPAAFAAIFMCILFKIQFWLSVCVLIVCVVFCMLNAVCGLVINLKLPNLHWTNELHAVKQSMAALLSMFLEWGVLVALVGGYFLFGEYLFTSGYMLFCIALIITVCGVLIAWLQKRGKKIFEEL